MFLVTKVGSDKKKNASYLPWYVHYGAQSVQNIPEVADANILPLKKGYKNM